MSKKLKETKPTNVNLDTFDMQHKVRREVLDELWAADKVNHEGHWYVRLTDVVNIVGDYDIL